MHLAPILGKHQLDLTMQMLREYQEMFHLLKLYKTSFVSRHLFSSLNCSTLKTASYTSSVDVLIKTYNQPHIPLMLGVSYRHLHSSWRYVNPLGWDSIFRRPSHYEKSELRKNNIHTSFPLNVSAKSNKTSSSDNLLKEAKAKEYINLYLHSKIRMFRVICSASKYSIFMLLTSFPICTAALLGEVLTHETSKIIISSMAFYSALFSAQSYFLFAKFLCKVMISTDESFVKISHLTMFGKRHDLYVYPSDIIPVSGSLYDKNIHIVRFKNSPKKLFFFPHQGDVDTNYEVLEALFAGGGLKSETQPKK